MHDQSRYHISAQRIDVVSPAVSPVLQCREQYILYANKTFFSKFMRVFRSIHNDKWSKLNIVVFGSHLVVKMNVEEKKGGRRTKKRRTETIDDGDK